MKEQYKAKLIIRGLQKMSEQELRDLIIWLDTKVAEMRTTYSKPLPSKDYSQIYTSTLLK
jgi:hypothetical protein